MPIKRYLATKDTTITNAFNSGLTDVGRGTGSNMGFSDVVEVFSIYGQINRASSSLGPASGSTELSRVLFQFPVSGSTNSILADRSGSVIPASGSVDFYLRLYNTKHAFTLPKSFTLAITPMSRSWSEGIGLDMEEYTDLDTANWISASSGVPWTTYGGDHHTGSYIAGTTLPAYSASFDSGTEDLELNITSLVEEWLSAGAVTQRQDYGVGVHLTSSYEAYFSSSTGLNSSTSYELHNVAGAKRSYYTKKFFARGTEFFYKRPVIEARWDSSKKDNAGNFYLSSSLASATDNLNTLYLYNFVRGQLKNIPDAGTGSILLSVYGTLGESKDSLPVGGGVVFNSDSTLQVNVTGGYVASGVYSASFAYTGSFTTIYPVWHSGSTGDVEYHTGSAITIKSLLASNTNPNPKYVTSIINLKPFYSKNEDARFRLYARQKDWNPTIYTKAAATAQTEIIEDAYYKIFRVVDDLEVVPYGTGSLNYTRLSYDASGSYFDFDTSLLEVDYAYGIKFVYYVNGAYHEQEELFKFRVE